MIFPLPFPHISIRVISPFTFSTHPNPCDLFQVLLFRNKHFLHMVGASPPPLPSPPRPQRYAPARRWLPLAPNYATSLGFQMRDAAEGKRREIPQFLRSAKSQQHDASATAATKTPPLLDEPVVEVYAAKASHSHTHTQTHTPTHTPTHTQTHTQTHTPTHTQTQTQVSSESKDSASPTASASASATATPTATATASRSGRSRRAKAQHVIVLSSAARQQTTTKQS